MQVEEAKDILRKNGYLTEGLWHIKDVQDNYVNIDGSKVSDEDAFKVLSEAFRNKSEDWIRLDMAANSFDLKLDEDEDYEDYLEQMLPSKDKSIKFAENKNMNNHEIIKKFMNDESFYLSIDFSYETDLDDVRDMSEAVQRTLDEVESTSRNEFYVTHQQYDTDWNLLMEAVHKIMYKEEYIGNTYREELADVVPFGVMHDVVVAVVNFINSLNK